MGGTESPTAEQVVSSLLLLTLPFPTSVPAACHFPRELPLCILDTLVQPRRPAGLLGVLEVPAGSVRGLGLAEPAPPRCIARWKGLRSVPEWGLGLCDGSLGDADLNRDLGVVCMYTPALRSPECARVCSSQVLGVCAHTCVAGLCACMQ